MKLFSCSTAPAIDSPGVLGHNIKTWNCARSPSRFAGVSVSALLAMCSADPTDNRSLRPNTAETRWRDSQGGGEQFGESAMIEKLPLPLRVELFGHAALLVLAILNCLR